MRWDKVDYLGSYDSVFIPHRVNVLFMGFLSLSALAASHSVRGDVNAISEEVGFNSGMLC